MSALLDISRAIETYHSREEKLPGSLAVLKQQPDVYLTIDDGSRDGSGVRIPEAGGNDI